MKQDGVGKAGDWYLWIDSTIIYPEDPNECEEFKNCHPLSKKILLLSTVIQKILKPSLYNVIFSYSLNNSVSN